MAETILIVEDEPVQRKMIGALLSKKLGYGVLMASHGKDALERIESSNIGEISAVLLDIQMPEMDGFETLQAIRKYRPDLPVIMLTGSDDTNIAVRAIKEGASDFILKPPNPAQLDIAIKNAIRLSALSRELTKMKRDKEGALAFTDLVGHNAGLSEAVAYGRKAAASNVPVLIMGETGVGKELFARAIHGESKRVGAPFVAINCSAIPEHLVESTLFSADKGALRKAEAGTLFLDDVGELPAEAQVRLLRLLQHKDIEPAGGGKPFKANVRIIAASERDLTRDVQAGKFREDLYFRLNILPITLAPLRNRKQDIIPIAEYFIERLSASEGLLPKALAPQAQHYLTMQRWSGNVRELENLIHRALVLTDDDVIDDGVLKQIHEASGSAVPAERRAALSLHINLRTPEGYFKTMSEIETETLRTMLNHFNQNITRAADTLGIAKSTFYRKIKDAPE
jgi:DNA-binding NtrC family response regulator